MIKFNVLLLAYLVFFSLRVIVQWLLTRLNITYSRRHGKEVPDVLRDWVNQETFQKISAYTRDSTCFGLTATWVNEAFFLALLLSGFLPSLVRAIHSWGLGPIVEGLFFFAFLSIYTNLIRIPFDLYETFVIERRYGFNTTTLRLWLLDLAKSMGISAVLAGFVLWLFMTLVLHGGSFWWGWAWICFTVFELLLLWLFPLVIAPLFNKFEPIRDDLLEQRIRELMKKAGLGIKGVLKMDASKRSKHTNAYFTGIGKSKRIVLFDTLLGSHGEEEILAVLAHEAGHWKKKHLLKMTVLVEALSLAAFYFIARFIKWPFPYDTFGFQESLPYVGLFLVGTFAGPLGHLAQPLESALSRRFEREADDFGLDLMKTGEPMRTALKRLAIDNLANLTPHPLYAWFYYSHPPLIERISRLSR